MITWSRCRYAARSWLWGRQTTKFLLFYFHFIWLYHFFKENSKEKMRPTDNLVRKNYPKLTRGKPIQLKVKKDGLNDYLKPTQMRCQKLVKIFERICVNLTHFFPKNKAPKKILRTNLTFFEHLWRLITDKKIQSKKVSEFEANYQRSSQKQIQSITAIKDSFYPSWSVRPTSTGVHQLTVND